MPRALRKSVAAALAAVPPDRWTTLLSTLPSRLLMPQIGDKLHTVATILKLDSADALYQRLVSHCEPARIMSRADEPWRTDYDKSLAKELPELLERMQLLDLVTYLPDDILTKVDRASMAVALEVRVPLLDHRVVEFSWRLPRAAKVRNKTSKWLLRQILYRHVPAALVKRPKSGFDLPLGEWLRGPLRDWAEGMLNERRMREAGFVNHSMVGRIWKEHLEGTRNWQDLLWNVLMLESWRECWT
jgi:asparagine synthase (glutamine-hydrolysing)